VAKGDHIKVRRYGGLYAHHGIEVGDGSVVHFSGEPFNGVEPRVCRVPLEEFVEGGTPKVVRYHEELRDPEQVVAEALRFVARDEAGEREDYRLWRNNCEHFASFCKIGRRRSSQVRRAVKVAAGVVAGGVAVGAALAGAALRRRRRD